MTKCTLDSLFLSLQPYLQIQPQEPGETARQIIRAVRQGKYAHEITAMLAKKGLCSLDSDLLAHLQGSVRQDMIKSIQQEFSKIEGNLGIRLPNPTRRIILERFFPQTPVFQEDAEKTSVSARIAYSIQDPEQRNFCSWCIAISEDNKYSNYFGGFFTATTKISRDIRDQFLDLFTHSAEQVLSEMTENCASFLKEKGIDSWPAEKLTGFRGTLLRLGTSFIDQLMELSQSRSDSVMFPQLSKGKSAAYYKTGMDRFSSEGAVEWRVKSCKNASID